MAAALSPVLAVPCSGPGAELPGQVPLLPLPGGRAGGRAAAQRGGAEAEPGGAAGHPAAPLADRTRRPHEDDLEETVGICHICKKKVPESQTRATMFELIYSLFLRCSPSERTAEDLEIIYEELLHIKALAHLSTTVSRGGHHAHFSLRD